MCGERNLTGIFLKKTPKKQTHFFATAFCAMTPFVLPDEMLQEILAALRSNKDAMRFLSTCWTSLKHVDAYKQLAARRHDARIVIFRCFARWYIRTQTLMFAYDFLEDMQDMRTHTVVFAFETGYQNYPTVVCDGKRRHYKTIATVDIREVPLGKNNVVEWSFMNDTRNLRCDLASAEMGDFIEDGSFVMIVYEMDDSEDDSEDELD